jgi:hypothetical protein
MVRNTVPPPKERFYGFFLKDKLGKTMIMHRCPAMNFPNYVDLDSTGNCTHCKKSYSFEALRRAIG